MNQIRQRVQQVCRELFADDAGSMAQYAEAYLLGRVYGQVLAPPSAGFDLRLGSLIGRADPLQWWSAALAVLRRQRAEDRARPDPEKQPELRQVLIVLAQALAAARPISLRRKRLDALLCRCHGQRRREVDREVMQTLIKADDAVRHGLFGLLASWVCFDIALEPEDEPDTVLRSIGWWSNLNRAMPLRGNTGLVPLALEYLGHSSPQCRWLAVSLLMQIEAGETQWARSVLDVLAQDPEPSVRGAAVRALANVADRVAAVAPAILAIMADPSASQCVQLAAIAAAPRLGDAAESAIPTLLRWLRQPATGLDAPERLHARQAAAQSLGRIGRQPAIVVPALLEIVCGEDYMTEWDLLLRWEAASAIGNFGPAGTPAFGQLMKFLLRQPGQRLCAAISHTLSLIAESQHAEELRSALRSSLIPAMREMMLIAMQHLAETMPAAKEVMLATSNGDADAGVRNTAKSLLHALARRQTAAPGRRDS